MINGARRPRLGRRRHRGRGGAARPAARHCYARGRRRRVDGALREGVTATDLVLTVTEMLRKHGVVGKFVEFCGAGLSSSDSAGPRDDRQHVARVRRDRRDSSRSTPRRCATCGRPGRADVAVDLVERTRRRRACSATTTRPTPTSASCSSSTSTTVEPSLAGPRRPQDRVAALGGGRRGFRDAYLREPNAVRAARRATSATRRRHRGDAVAVELRRRARRASTHGSVVIAAIT